MKRAMLLLLPALLLFVAGYGQQKPNIIFILADDLGYGDLGIYGQHMIRTPHIDSLASRGMRFTNYYAGCSVCAPSRETLLTGRHTGHTYIRGNFLTDSKEDPPMPDSMRTTAELLKAAGYHTALIGKWGLGGEAHGPEKQGFDYSYGYLDQIHAHNYYPTYLYENGKKFFIDENRDSARKVLSEDLFIKKTLDYLGRTDAKQPFFLYLPYTFPHGEYNLPPDTPYSSTDWPKQFKVYATMVTRLDKYVGNILQVLKERGIADNTLIFFTSDNGANMGFAKFFNSNGVLNGSKFGLYEGGIRVPMIACWPGHIQPGQVSPLITASWDMLPTICNITGLAAPKGIDGISFLPELRGKKQSTVHEFLYWEYYNYNYNWAKPDATMPRNWLESVALRMGKWKVMKKNMYNDKNAPLELYDLVTDPGEKDNVAAQHPDVLKRAEAILAASSVPNAPYFPYQPSMPAQTPGWKTRLLNYVGRTLAKSDGGYGWEDQPDSHLEPTFAAVGILNDVGALPDKRDALIAFIRSHHPQRQANKETGPSGFVPRTLLYEQIRSIQWLGGDLSGFRKEVEAEKSDTRNLYNYEDHGYGVFDQEVLTLVCNHLLQTGQKQGYPGLVDYIGARRRENGSFNNATSTSGGDGNILNTYWGLYALQILGKNDEKKQSTIQWLKACQLKNGGFTHQPHPVIGANDDVAYTWAAVQALQLLSAEPARVSACIRYLVSLENPDGGFGNRPGLPSTPMSTFYALDALNTLHALSSLDKAKPKELTDLSRRDLSGYKVFTVQIQSIGNGSPSEAVLLADSLHIQLWGAKNAPQGWVETAQKAADEKKVPVTFFHADEPYGKNVLVEGMGSFGHILDNYYPAGTSLSIPDSALWQDLSKGFLPSLKDKKGGLVLQISNNEPLVRILLDESIKTGQGYAAISTIHFGQNFLFFLPFLYQYRHQLPFIALQDAHGTESWWWSNDLVAYRTLFLAKEPTYAAMIDAIKANRIVAVRHDSVTAFKTRMLGGAPGVQEYILAQKDSWKWWDESTNDLHHPWTILTVVNPGDSFEVARAEKASVIRIRPWWHTDKQIMKFPLVALRQLFVDDKPVEYQYVEKKNRMGAVTDSYYLYEVPETLKGEHRVRMICRNIRTDVERTQQQTVSFSKAAAAGVAASAGHRIVLKSAAELKDLFHYSADRVPFISSHRGGPLKGFPENSTATFENTLQHSWSMMEMDPHYTKDSQLVVMHDPTLDRTSDGHGRISSYTLAELKKVRLKDPEGNVTGYGIQTLDEMLEWAKGKTILVVDMKEVPIEVRVKKIEEHHAENSAIVIAYSFEDAQKCYRMNSNIVMEVMMPDREAVARFDSTGVPWGNVVAFITHTQPKDKDIFRLVHEKGALCMMGSSRSVDREFQEGKIGSYEELMERYKGLIREGADIIEADRGIDAGAAVQSIRPAGSPKEKYFLRK